MSTVPPDDEVGHTRFEDPPTGPPDATRIEPPELTAGPTRIEDSLVGGDATRIETSASPGSATPHDSPPPGSARHVLPQAILADYDYVRDISYGAQADVIEGRRRDNGLPVAIKLYRAASPEIDRDLVAKLQRALPDHVAPIIDVRSAEGRTWEVQEFFPLGSLDQLVDRRGGGPMPHPFVRQLVTDLSAAIDHIHSLDIVHRDIKPQNILIRADDPVDCVLADFGIAQVFVMSALGGVAGTFPYLAPEGTHGRVSRAGDWWALGVITHSLLTGRHMFADPARPGQLLPEGVIRGALAEGTYSFSDVTDPRWLLLLQGLLTFNRADRWAGPHVQAWLRGESPKVTPRTATSVPLGQARLIFKGAAYTEPNALAAAFRANWTSACEYLAGHGLGLLFEWLHQTEVGERADGVLTAVQAGVRPTDAALVDLQLLLDPSTTPTFDGRQLSSDGLGQAITAAARNQDAQRWITRLRTNAVLTTVATHLTDSATLAAADEQLRDWWRTVESTMAKLVNDPEVRHVAPEARSAIEGQLLHAALDPSIHRALHQRAVKAGQKSPTGLPEVLQELIGGLPKKPQSSDVAVSVVATALATLVGQRRADAAAEQDRATRATREAEAAVTAERLRREAAARRRQALRQARGAARARLVPVVVATVAAGVWLHRGRSDLLATALAAGKEVGIPLLAAVGIAFIADVVLPQWRSSGLSRAVGLIAAFMLLAQRVPWSRLSAVGDYFALTSVPIAAAMGYAAASAAGSLLQRQGVVPRAAYRVPFRWWVLPGLTVVSGALVHLGGVVGLRPGPGWLFAWPGWLEAIGNARLGSLSAGDGLGRFIVISVALWSALLIGSRRDLGGRSRRIQRIVWGSTNVAALVAVLLAIPYLVQVTAENQVLGIVAAAIGGVVWLILLALG